MPFHSLWNNEKKERNHLVFHRLPAIQIICHTSFNQNINTENKIFAVRYDYLLLKQGLRNCQHVVFESRKLNKEL